MNKNWLVPLLILLIFNLKGFCEIIYDFEKNLSDWQCVGEEQNLEISPHYAFSGRKSLALKVNSKKEGWIRISKNLNWSENSSISFHIYLPEESEVPVNFVCYIKDKEWNWFETPVFSLKKGHERRISLDLTNKSSQWKPKFHIKSWDEYISQKIKEFGIKFFSPYPYNGYIYIDCFELEHEQKKNTIYLYNYRTNSSKIKKFKKFEVTFEIPVTFKNPFDPEIIDIEGIFQTPSGKAMNIPAFFYQDYIKYLDEGREKLLPYGKGEWKIRFTPEETGKYQYKISIKWKDKNLLFDAGKFEVIESKNPGFIRWDNEDNGYLSFSNKQFFYPIGHTLRSPDDIRQPYNYEFEPEKERGTFAYDTYFPKMRSNGENYARVWMSAWWMGIEWTYDYATHYSGIGRYSLENSWQLDYLLDLAEKYGIYIDLTLINHGQFSIRPDQEWWDNPYNILNGGFLSSPDEFLINEKAQKYFKQRLRYIVARWGYSPNIAFWELWNEIDLTGYYDTDKVRKWHKKVVPYLKSIDPWEHIVTTHYCRPQADPIAWIVPEIESIVGNSYNKQVVKTIKEFYLKRVLFNKPIMINEFGVGKNKKSLEDNLHAGIWTSSVMPMFGVALFWWWPFIDYYNLYFHYRALSNFWKGEDRRCEDLQLSDAFIIPDSNSKKNRVEIIGMQNKKKGYFWAYDSKIFNSRITGRIKKIKGVNIKVKNFIPGDYRIEFWNTYEGKISHSEIKKFRKRIETISFPEFTKDIAIKIKRVKNNDKSI